MGRPPLGKVSMTGAERTRRYRARLRHTKPVTKSVSPDNAALVRELAQARARIGELEAELREKDMPRADTAAEVAELRDENYAFRVELEARNHVFKTRAGGGLTAAQYRMLQMLGHPDDSLSEKKKNEAIRLINQLRYVLCNEAELPSMDPKKYSTWARQQWRRRQEEIKEAKKYAKRRRQPKASPKPSKSLPRT